MKHDELQTRPVEDRLMDNFIRTLREHRPKKVKLRFGELKGDPEKFLKVFDYMVKGTALEGTEIDMKKVKAKIECIECDWKGDPHIEKHNVLCPRCKSDVIVHSGDEFSFHV